MNDTLLHYYEQELTLFRQEAGADCPSVIPPQQRNCDWNRTAAPIRTSSG